MFRGGIAGGQVETRICKAFLAPVLLTIALMFATKAATDTLDQPSVCSAIEAGASELQFPFCRVTPAEGKPGQHVITLSLSATTSPIQVGGYRVSGTDNYNGGYLAPTVEIKPGDTLKVRLLNTLAPSGSTSTTHGSSGHAEATRSTNLHTHGLIVSPKNARAELPQNGDNIFAKLDRGQSLDYSIEIPTALPASLLDGKSGIIPHPSGPFWYHSHQHRVSATQVAGGMSGLLSIGARDVNLVATKPAETASLKARTDVSYLMLRDIQIMSATDPKVADGQSPATWMDEVDTTLCEAGLDGVLLPPVRGREGYCQDPKDKTRIWLFSINGQRFPTIKIPSGRNNLWRLANLSASATYVISLRDVLGNPVSFDLISVDGVVPGVPNEASGATVDSPEAIKVSQLLLMPAARAEILIENDTGEVTERRLVLRTDGLDTSMPGTRAGDRWPEIKLADVILEGTAVVVAAAAHVGLNVAVAKPSPPKIAAFPGAAAVPSLPPGCVRDIDRVELEHRRIQFANGFPTGWTITTQLVRPKDKTNLQPYQDFEPADNVSIDFVGFERYLKSDGSVDWEGTGDGNDPNVKPRHTCVRLSNGHGQLWELSNPTAELHNFHLHQTKFRLAREQDLRDYGIEPSSVPVKSGLRIKAHAKPVSADRDLWNDTLPIAANETIFIIVNFDAEEQVGRYVFHCHILKHEDGGLMAPMEVLR